MSKLLVILIVTVVLVVLGVGGYFLFRKSGGNSLESLLKDLEETEEEVTPEEQKQVFNVSDNVFNYDEARSVCEAYNGDLASLEQMVDAYKNGADWCNYGWSEGQLALYPTQKDFWEKLQNNGEDI